MSWRFLPWPTSPGYSLDSYSLLHTPSPPQGPTAFLWVPVFRPHSPLWQLWKCISAIPGSGKHNWTQLHCGLLKSITIYHACCGMLPASIELSRDTRACPFLGDIGQLWWVPWAWGPPIELAEHPRSALQFLFHSPTYPLVLWPTVQSDALSASQATGPFSLRGPSPIISLAYQILSPASQRNWTSTG